MCTSSPSSPRPPPPLPEAPQMPDETAGRTADSDRRRRRAAQGGSGAGTILTGSRGVQDGAATGGRTLLGQ